MPIEDGTTPPTAEQIEQERKDAEAAFAAEGGDGAQPAATAAAQEQAAGTVGDGDAAGQEKKQAEGDTVAGGETKTEAPDPWEGVPAIVRQTLESISGKVGAVDALRRDVASNNGRLQRFQDQVLAGAAAATKAAGAAAPTASQMAAAAKSTAKWEQQKADFPEWADALEERLAAERADITAKLPQSTQIDVDSIRESVLNEVQSSQDDVINQARRLARLDLKYETWDKDVKSKDFQDWHKSQPPEVQALAASNDADDAMSMLDKFYQHRKAVATKTEKQKQLERAIPPRGSSNQRQITLSEQEAMAKAFASA